MRKIVVEVVGVEPPCPRCRKALEVVYRAVKELGLEDRVSVVKLNASSQDVIAKYGTLLTPAIIVNGVVRVLGRVPEKDEIIDVLKEAIRSEEGVEES